MDDTTRSLLIGAASTLAGVIVTKWLDIFQSSKQHELDLKKEYFNRKLSTFEKSVAQWTTGYIGLQNIASIFNAIIADNSEIDSGTLLEMFSRIDKQIADISAATNEQAGAIGLYTDINENNQSLWTNEFMQLLGELTFTGNELQRLQQDINNIQTQQEQILREQNITIQENAMHNKIERLNALSLSIRNIYLAQIRQLRTIIKRYE